MSLAIAQESTEILKYVSAQENWPAGNSYVESLSFACQVALPTNADLEFRLDENEHCLVVWNGKRFGPFDRVTVYGVVDGQLFYVMEDHNFGYLWTMYGSSFGERGDLIWFEGFHEGLPVYFLQKYEGLFLFWGKAKSEVLPQVGPIRLEPGAILYETTVQVRSKKRFKNQVEERRLVQPAP